MGDSFEISELIALPPTRVFWNAIGHICIRQEDDGITNFVVFDRERAQALIDGLKKMLSAAESEVE